MSKARIVYVPGKNLKPAPEEHRPQLWRCLLHGVAKVDSGAARDLTTDPSLFTLAAWNHAYYKRDISLRDELPWIDRLLQTPQASALDRAEAKSWSKWAVKLMYALGDRFHGLIRFIPDPRVKAMIADTARYFDNEDDIACAVREIVKKPLRDAMFNGDRILLIAHSMGSVIAYDALWELAHIENMHGKVDLFLTLGSPLGMHYVQRHLLGLSGRAKRYPHTISRWINVSAEGDLVSVDQTVSDDFSGMIDAAAIEHIEDFCHDVYNAYRNRDGLNVHRSFGYLVNRLVGQIVADWWCDVKQEHDSLSQTRSGKKAIPELVAHRGFPQQYPENTLAGYKAALAAGACYLECDVQLTADRVPVLYHDKDLRRTSGVAGLINETSLAQLSALDACQPRRFGARFRGVPVPTLAEFVELVESVPRVSVFVELKRGSLKRFGIPAVVDRVMQDLASISSRIILISFDHACLAYARHRHGARIGWVLPGWNNKNRLVAMQLAPEFLFCEDKQLPAHKFAIWQGSWRWAIYVVDEPAQAIGIGKLGIDLIETDAIGDMLVDHRLKRRACH